MCECEFCNKHHKPLLTYHYDSIYTEIKLVNHTQLDAMTTVTDQRGKTTSIGQSNRINYCPMCGRKLI